MYTGRNQYHVVMEAAPEFLQSPEMLDQVYTIFGVVTGGLEVAQNIAQGDRIQSIEILDPAGAVFSNQKERLAEWNSILDKKFGRRLSPAPQTS